MNELATKTEQALAPVREMPLELNLEEMKRRKQLVIKVVRELMKDGEHYGKIPGTNSPTLYKSGAEMLGTFFQLFPRFEVRTREFEHGHREYTMECTLFNGDRPVCMGMGLATTMESKHRWRYAQPKCPSCHRETIFRRKDGSGHYCWAKKGGCGANFEADDSRIQPAGKIENPDVADVYNTVLKMAMKRAHVGAILMATAASDMFRQEEEAPEDLDDDGDPVREEPQQKRAAAAPLTEKQELAHECAKIASGLGRSKEEIAELINAGGGYAPKDSWNQLTVGELRKAREILAEEATLTQGGA